MGSDFGLVVVTIILALVVLLMGAAIFLPKFKSRLRAHGRKPTKHKRPVKSKKKKQVWIRIL